MRVEYFACPDSSANWVVVTTHPHREALALSNLERQQFTTYLPKIRKRIQVAAVALANKKSISYCAKNVAGQVQQEGKVGSTRRELDCWSKTLPQTRTIAMEATIFTGWLDFGGRQSAC